MLNFMKPNHVKSSEEEEVLVEGDQREKHSMRDKLMSALFYGVSSLAVIFINKTIMSVYRFPYFDFLAASQFLVTTLILSILISTKYLENIPSLSLKVVRDIMPISIMFLGNVICGLGSTRSLSLPMLTALRRFSILMTMIAEWITMGTRPQNPIIISVTTMVGGACFAAMYDFSFDMVGYSLVFLNNIFTALSGVWMKKASMSSKFNKMTVLYYNSLFSAIAMVIFFVAEDIAFCFEGAPSLLHWCASGGDITGVTAADTTAATTAAASRMLLEEEFLPTMVAQSTLLRVVQFDQWFQWDFLLIFFMASLLGSVLNYAIFLCTNYNSALTTAVIGCLKNVLTTYVGMLAFSDYTFNWLNFVGLNISIAGSLYYTYVTMFKGVQGFGAG